MIKIIGLTVLLAVMIVTGEEIIYWSVFGYYKTAECYCAKYSLQPSQFNGHFKTSALAFVICFLLALIIL